MANCFTEGIVNPKGCQWRRREKFCLKDLNAYGEAAELS